MDPLSISKLHIDTMSYPIQGKMVGAQVTIPDYYFNNVDPQYIKSKLATEFVTKMLENKLIEFTQMSTPMGDKVITCRVFITPDSDVRLLREHSMRKI